MMTAKKRRAYLAIMVLGGLALVVDRFILPTPVATPETATAAAPLRPGAPTPDSVDETERVWSIPELPFPRQVSAYSVGTRFRDIFAPPGQQWTSGAADDGTHNVDGPEGGSVVKTATAASFHERHRLAGVIILQRLKIAVVDDRWLQIGESLDACTLFAITENEAKFRCHDGESSLSVIATGGE